MSKETTKKRSQSARSKTQTRSRSGAKPRPKSKVKAQAKARKRQQKKLILLVGGIVVLVAVIIAGLFLSGIFGGGKKADGNSVYILEDGKIVSTNVEAFDESQYSKSELKTFMGDVIKEYNQKNGKNSVKQKDFYLKNNEAVIVLQYEDADAFTDFYGRELFVGTIADAIESGYDFEVPFAKISANTAKECTSEEFLTDDTYKVAIIKANTKLMVEGEICYVSTENVQEAGSDHVITKAGTVLEMEALERVEETESEETVNDEELLSDSAIVFDFGNETTKESEYSETCTYIIYK